MKQFIKENGLYTLSLIFLIIIVINSSLSYIKNEEKRIDYEKNVVDYCKTLDLNLEENKKYIDYCSSANDYALKTDFFSTLALGSLSGMSNIQLYIFLFVSIPTLAYICRYLKKEVIKDMKTKSYKDIIYTFIKKSYKHVTIIPIAVLAAFIISYVYNGSFHYVSEYVNSFWTESSMDHPYIFSIFYILRTIFFSIFYVNICLSIARKKHNFILSVILSYISLFALQISFELILNGIISSTIFKSEFGLIFTAMGIIDYKDSFGIIYPLIFSMILAVVSSIIVYFIYKDKEKLIIDCGGNI